MHSCYYIVLVPKIWVFKCVFIYSFSTSKWFFVFVTNVPNLFCFLGIKLLEKISGVCRVKVGMYKVFCNEGKKKTHWQNVHSLGNHYKSSDSAISPAKVPDSHPCGLMAISVCQWFSLSHIIRMRPAQLTG